MFWLIAATLSYLFFGLASLGDKIVLAGPSKPKTYTFLVGIFSLFAVLLIPFIGFKMPSDIGFYWIILEAIVYVFGLYSLFVALENYDVSRVVPMIGATQPIFIFLLTIVYWGSQSLRPNEVMAFAVLLTGSVIISIDKDPKVTKDSLAISVLTSLMFSLDFIFSKFVFTEMSFWHGFIWMRLLSVFFVMFLFFDKEFRTDIFKEKEVATKKTGMIFILAQLCGGLANILQSWAIFLAPVVYLAIMNSVKGLQYVFLFIMTYLISIFFPKVLKEEISKKIIIQKIASIILIAIGLAILVLG